jgi:hypothetical protein
MVHKIWKLAAFCMLFCTALISLSAGPIPPGTVVHRDSLPLSFEPNQGQADPAARFVSRGAGYTVLLSEMGAILTVDTTDEADRLLERMDGRARKRFEAHRFYKLSPRFHHSENKKRIGVRMDGANASAKAVPLDKLAGVSNYFVGRDSTKWLTGIPTYGKVRYEDVYPGIDLVYYGRRGELEFDFVLKPGADPDVIHLHIDTPVSISKDGGVSVLTSGGALELLRPTIYQVRDGKKISVEGQFVARGDGSIGFQVGDYDRSAQLLIDPVLSYSTYLGGNGSDYNSGVVVDSQGNTYIAGQTTSTNFPTSNAYSSTGNSNGVAFVTKMNANGTAVLYSTYLGGSGGDWAAGIALDPSNNVYVIGSTMSTDFPTVNPVQKYLLSPNGNVFVARLDTTQSGAASLVYSTYLGGGGNASNSLGDVGLGIAVDSSGLAYVTGQTASDSSIAPFPTTDTALQTSLASTNGNAFLTVLDTTNGGPLSLVYSTYLGGASTGFGDYGVAIAVDGSRNAFVTGQTTSGAPDPFPTTSSAYQTTLNSANGNVFLTEIATAQSGASSLVYSTYLGGSSSIVVGDTASGVGLDSVGRVYVGGDTTSSDFPVTSGAYQTTNSAAGKAFVGAFNLTLSGAQSLIYSTFLGGTNGGEGEVINALVVSASGNAFVAGSSSSSDFPTTSAAYQTTLKNQSWDAFLSELNPAGTSLLYSTYFGGSCVNGDLGNGVALDWVGNPYLAGSTCSTDLSVYPANAYQTSLGGTYNAFIAKFSINLSPGISAIASPLPNANGWNNSPVTVSFICIPGGAPIQNCTSPIAVTSEGANQATSGTVLDTANNSADATDTVNLDLTPPIINITSPLNGATVTSNSLTLSGTATDALSGVGGVTCNGTQATLSGSNFSCTLTLPSANNSIAVIGTDLAGNTTTTTLNVTLAVPGGLAATGNLNVARDGQTATLLTNGLVLLAGGTGSNAASNTAELYDPSTGAFALTGNLNASHTNHTATLLNDGTVLIAGGYDSDGVPQNTAEIYSPASATFTIVSGMSSARASHTATLLNDGTVLFAGGFDANYNALASTELYNSATGTFTGLSNLNTGRVSHTATLLNDGKVLIAGGQDQNANALSASELYDPSTRTFSATGSLNIARDLQTATLLNNGMVLVTGGQDSNYNALASAELYNESNGSFGTTGAMTTTRVGDSATLLGNGDVLIAGGTDINFNFLSGTELYDPVAQTFSTSGSMSIQRASHSATLLTSGTVIIAGGYEFTGPSDPTLNSAEIYQPASLTPPNLSSIAVSPSTPSTSAGATQRFTATGTFSDNSTETLSSVTWSSSQTSIATVTNDPTNHGTAFGVAEGTATMSACVGSICGSSSLTVGATQLQITGLSPTAGSIGSQVIIAGTGFGATQGTSTVSFAGTAATPSLWSPTGITVTVPAGAASGNVTVNVGGTSSNGVPFLVSSGPVITSLSPTVGLAGTSVAVNGANFGSSQGSSLVTLNGLPVTVSSWSPTAIVISVPTGATTGNIVVTVTAASNGAEFTVPAITGINPYSGPVGTLLTIDGSGFGGVQNSGSVTINGTAMQVLSWGDSQILAAVSTGTASGLVGIHQGSVTLSGSMFTVSNTPTYTAVSQLTLLVGQSTTVSVLDANGSPVSGLKWRTTNPNIVSLSSDDPPALTGLTSGSATVYAGSAPIAVTVYMGSLPAGTVLWSLPNEGVVVPAIPTANGVDAFLQSGNNILAVTADGAIAWQTSVANSLSFTPDFLGGGYVYQNVACGSNCFTHQVTRIDSVTHQPSILHTFATTLDSSYATFTDDTLTPEQAYYTDRLGTEAVVPDTLGNVFVQDTNQILLFNPAGQQVAVVPLETSHLTNTTAGQTIEIPPISSKLIVAGDGNAYVAYSHSDVATQYSDTHGYYTGLDTSNIDSFVKLIRISPDGSYSKIQLGHAQWHSSGDANGVGCFYGVAQTPWLNEFYNLDRPFTPSSLFAMTNADQGVAVLYPTSTTPFENCESSSQIMAYVSGDSITSQTALTVSNGNVFWPILQRTDGTYVGTAGTFPTQEPSATEFSTTVVAVGSSGQLWTQSTGDLLLPEYATADGNVTVTSTQNAQLGSLYTLDQSGNIVSEAPDNGAYYSWTNNWYTNQGGITSMVAGPPLDIAPTFAAFALGNPSNNGTSIKENPYPPLQSCSMANGNICVNESLLTALYGLQSTVITNCPDCLKFVFDKIGTAGDQQLFSRFANRRAGFFDGTKSTFRMQDISGDLGSIRATQMYQQFLGTGVTVADQFRAHPDADALAYFQPTAAHGSSSKQGLLIFFNPSLICTDSIAPTSDCQKRLMSLLFHEGLHEFYGLSDADLQFLLGVPILPRCSADITDYIEGGVYNRQINSCGSGN